MGGSAPRLGRIPPLQTIWSCVPGRTKSEGGPRGCDESEPLEPDLASRLHRSSSRLQLGSSRLGQRRLVGQWRTSWAIYGHPLVPGLQPIDLSTNHGSIALRSGLHTPLYEVSATTLMPASVVSPGGDVSLGRAGAHPQQSLGRERRVLPARARRTFDE